MLSPLLVAAALVVPQQDTLSLTLDAAVERALTVSPRVLAAEGAADAPRGRRSENLWPFPSNPRLEYGRVRRSAPGGTTFDRGWVISQEVEIAGQSFVRRGASDRRVDAAEALATDARRLAALDARKAYAGLLIAESRAALTDSAAAFAERLSVLARRQLEAGEATRLIYNAAVLEAARQRSVAGRARAELAAAAADLGRILALPGGTVLKTVSAPALPRTLPDDSTALALARERRRDLAAAGLEAGAAAREVTAARLGLVPNLELGLELGQEASVDDLFGFSIGVSVPLFHRQQASTGSARAEAAAARAAYEDTERRLVAEVGAALERFRRAAAAEQRFADEVLSAASENVVLTDRAFTEGKVDLTDVVVLRRAAVDAQLEYLAVRGAAYDAWFELAAALGVDPDNIATPSGVQE